MNPKFNMAGRGPWEETRGHITNGLELNPVGNEELLEDPKPETAYRQTQEQAAAQRAGKGDWQEEGAAQLTRNTASMAFTHTQQCWPINKEYILITLTIHQKENYKELCNITKQD